MAMMRTPVFSSPSTVFSRPGFGDRRKEMLQDIAVLTGGTVVSEEVGLELKNADLSVLGQARQVKVDTGGHHVAVLFLIGVEAVAVLAGGACY